MLVGGREVHRVGHELALVRSELEQEMAQVVNKVTIEALKEKARSMGEIKEISENAEAGELTIKLEV